jgi:hypothetical protein
LSAFAVRQLGPFAWQPNNSTRVFEYPWVAAQTKRLGPRLDIVEIGGGLSGLQFVLSKAGHRVINVDPGIHARGKGWRLDPKRHERLARVFGAPVDRLPMTIGEAGLPDASADVLISVSAIEHFAPDDREELTDHVKRLLRAEGAAILTIDLFLDLAPFSGRQRNRFGVNIDVAALLADSGLRLAVGERAELYGFPQFDPASVQSKLSEYLVGTGYPALAQCLVATKAR